MDTDDDELSVPIWRNFYRDVEKAVARRRYQEVLRWIVGGLVSLQRVKAFQVVRDTDLEGFTGYKLPSRGSETPLPTPESLPCYRR